MKAAILTNSDNSFYKPLAEGLDRMLNKLNVKSTILYDGLDSLPQYAKKFNYKLNQVFLKTLIQRFRAYQKYKKLIRNLKDVDFIVIVNHVPIAYYDFFFNDKLLRADIPNIPIVLYDLVYLPTRGLWAKWILENNTEKSVLPGTHWGLNRYDYYLCVNEVSEFKIPQGCDIFKRIGLNIEDNSLFIENNKNLIALIDFERPEYLYERAIQIQACVEAGIPFKVLHGSYSIQKIREIYRSCSLYFIAHRESFGLPVCEVQACGALVFTPYISWCPSHYVKQPSENGEAQLPNNFIVYNNDKNLLVNTLIELKKEFNPNLNLSRFKLEQPDFYYGNLKKIQEFLDLITDGTINGYSHKSYPTLSTLVKTIGEY